MKNSPQRVKGTVDFLPSHALLFQEIIQVSRKILKFFGYEEIILPILEDSRVFLKVGEFTDIIEKQMFKIEGKDVVLRPEGTAQVVRFFIEHNLWKEKEFHKFFYIGPMFRGERPQKGRLRQFHHIGAEALGSNSPFLDAEVIEVALAILKELGIKELELKINSLGCQQDKEVLRKKLGEKLKDAKEKLCPTCQKRLDKNSLRILDCKEKKCQKIVKEIDIKGFLCDACQRHFEAVLRYLDKLGISYTYLPTLVRGLDYYTHTVFEITSAKLGSQDACGAGGRYNSLVKNMGGPDIPGVGFALGVERIMLLLKEKEMPSNVKVFIAYTPGYFDKAVELLTTLRRKGIPSQMSYLEKSLKAQLRFSHKIGADFVIIIGEEEVKNNFFTLKDMKKSLQEKVSWERLLERIC